MDKRYQVFISSTFRDLIEERQAVLKAVLELNHMPAGMELFAAGDDEAWQLIREVIDSSDYYLLVVGGRYGSLDRSGISYTEKEYDYAVSLRRPVLPLLHRNPDNLPRGKTDTDKEAWTKLQALRRKVEERHTCAYWERTDELKAAAVLALTAAVKRHPAVGWIRADQVPTDATVSDVLRLRERISSLEGQLELRRTMPPEQSKDLAQGDDTNEISYSFAARKELEESPYHEDTAYNARIVLTWNDIFGSVAPALINEVQEADLRRALRSHFIRRVRESLSDVKKIKGLELRAFSFEEKDLDTVLVQLRALELIQISIKPRSVKDTGTYWALTPYGDTVMNRLRALRRPSQAPSATAPSSE